MKVLGMLIYELLKDAQQNSDKIFKLFSANEYKQNQKYLLQDHDQNQNII